MIFWINRILNTLTAVVYTLFYTRFGLFNIHTQQMVLLCTGMYSVCIIWTKTALNTRYWQIHFGMTTVGRALQWYYWKQFGTRTQQRSRLPGAVSVMNGVKEIFTHKDMRWWPVEMKRNRTQRVIGSWTLISGYHALPSQLNVVRLICSLENKQQKLD